MKEDPLIYHNKLRINLVSAKLYSSFIAPVDEVGDFSQLRFSMKPQDTVIQYLEVQEQKYAFMLFIRRNPPLPAVLPDHRDT